MSIDLLQPFNRVVHDTAKQVIDSDIPKKTAGVVNAFFNSLFSVVEDGLKKVVALTEKKTPAAPEGGS